MPVRLFASWAAGFLGLSNDERIPHQSTINTTVPHLRSWGEIDDEKKNKGACVLLATLLAVHSTEMQSARVQREYTAARDSKQYSGSYILFVATYQVPGSRQSETIFYRFLQKEQIACSTTYPPGIYEETAARKQCLHHLSSYGGMTARI